MKRWSGASSRSNSSTVAARALSLDEGLARIDGTLEHRLDAVADAVHRRLVAGVEQENAGRDEFVLAEPAAVAFGREKLADEVVAEIGAARAGVAAHEIGEFARRPRPRCPRPRG